MDLDYVSFAYAGFVLLGGVIGYFKAGSLVSLIAGTSFGGVLALGAYNVSKDPNNYSILLLSNTILAIVMGLRFYSSRKIMPAGIISVFSVLMIFHILMRALINS